jgi:hypothetical protein
MATSPQGIDHSLRPEGAGAQGQLPTLDPYITGHSAAFLATQCVDSDYPHDPLAYERLIQAEDRRQPYFGLTALFAMANASTGQLLTATATWARGITAGRTRSSL